MILLGSLCASNIIVRRRDTCAEGIRPRTFSSVMVRGTVSPLLEEVGWLGVVNLKGYGTDIVVCLKFSF